MTTIAYPGESSESYPEVFTKPPPMPAVLKPGQLSEQQFKQFFEEVRQFNMYIYSKLWLTQEHSIVSAGKMGMRAKWRRRWIY